MNAYTPASTTEGLELGITVEDFLFSDQTIEKSGSCGTMVLKSNLEF